MERVSDADLSKTEVHLHELIQGIGAFLSKDFKRSTENNERLEDIELEYRHQMRVLRRWRNGTHIPQSNDLDEFGRNLSCLRNYSIVLRLGVVQDTLEEIDRTLEQLAGDHVNITSQRQNIGCQLIGLRATTDTLEPKHYKKCEQELISVQSSIVNLRKSIKEEFKRVAKHDKNSLSRCSTFSLASLSGIPPIEEHPEVNRVLRSACRIRRMLQAFRAGHHVTLTDGDTTGCIENDEEVLQRQLHKVQQWQQSVQTFTSEEVDDLELILTAVERHLSSDVDLNYPSRDSTSRVSQITARSDSTDASSSHDTSTVTDSLSSTDAPPAYDEVCDMQQRDDIYQKTPKVNSDGELDVIDERLI